MNKRINIENLTACRLQLVDVQSVDTPEQKHGKQPLGVVGFK